MRFAFIKEQEVAFSVAAMCRALDVSRSGYYGWCAEPETARDHRDANLLVRIRAVFDEHRGRYGSPRIASELSTEDAPINEKRVARIMRKNRLVSRPKKRFAVTTDSTHEDPIAPNLVQREFTEEVPNSTWVTDVTAIWTYAGWLYLAAILDLYSRRVVGWATSANNDRLLALDALRAAVHERRPGAGLIHHSDRGSPYASGDYRAALKAHGMIASMSRRGDCWDNAVAESFFSTLKNEAFGAHVPAD